MAIGDDEQRSGGIQHRRTHRRIDKLMRDAEHLQQQADALLSRCRYLHGQLRIASAVAGAAILIAIGMSWWVAVGLPAAVAILDAIIDARRERRADRALELWRVGPEDFEDYAEAERRLQRELTEIEMNFSTPVRRDV